MKLVRWERPEPDAELSVDMTRADAASLVIELLGTLSFLEQDGRIAPGKGDLHLRQLLQVLGHSVPAASRKEPPAHVLEITNEQRGRLVDRTLDLMHHWHPTRDDSDYCCEFCGKHAVTNQGEVVHHQDCDGVALLKLLEARSKKTMDKIDNDPRKLVSPGDTTIEIYVPHARLVPSDLTTLLDMLDESYGFQLADGRHANPEQQAAYDRTRALADALRQQLQVGNGQGRGG